MNIVLERDSTRFPIPDSRSPALLGDIMIFPRTRPAIPYGIYDMGRNEAWVNVGRDHDTPAFAVASLRRWWKEMGRAATPRLVICSTADAGGSRVSFSRLEAS